LFQTEMVRNYLNLIKSKVKLRCFKQIWGFGGILGNLKEEGFPYSPGNEKNNFPNSPSLEM
jgi:hypothetical protein